ncbi:hypothetical protein E4U24_000840, partial [Claviceps purpurea]
MSAPPQSGLFTAPQPIRTLFKLFPLRVHDAEALPARAPDRVRERARLHVFSTEEDARLGRPSYNPGCLKWQVGFCSTAVSNNGEYYQTGSRIRRKISHSQYMFIQSQSEAKNKDQAHTADIPKTFLRIANLQVDLVPSTNHASPSGSLPYLLPSSSDSRPDIPLTGFHIANYAQKHSTQPLPPTESTPRQEAFLSLLGQNIRPAW